MRRFNNNFLYHRGSFIDPRPISKVSGRRNATIVSYNKLPWRRDSKIGNLEFATNISVPNSVYGTCAHSVILHINGGP